MREIRMLRTTRRKLETELRDGLRHREDGEKPPVNGHSPALWPPRQLSTLPMSDSVEEIPASVQAGRQSHMRCW